MTKKNKVKSDQLPVVSEEIASREEQERARNDMYIVGTWRGLPQYVCAACKFDTLDEVVMLKHLVNKHNSEAALEELVELEKAPSTSVPLPPSPLAPLPKGEGEADDEVFEVELIETDSTVDAQGNEHKKFTIKE
jgi:hypothetical protein